jgi:hypothetical protein
MIRFKRSHHESFALPPNAQIGVGAPEPALCRAKPVEGTRHDAFSGTAYCLIEPLPRCRFLRPFGFGGFCHHPEAHRIVARTMAGELKPGV